MLNNNQKCENCGASILQSMEKAYQAALDDVLEHAPEDRAIQLDFNANNAQWRKVIEELKTKQ